MNQRAIKFSLIAIAVFLTAAITITIGHAAIYKDRIYPGVRIKNLDVGGLTLPEATARADRAFTPTGQIYLSFKDKKWPVDLDRIGVKAKAADSAKLALSVGRRDGLFANLSTRYGAWTRGESVPVKWQIDKEKTTQVLKKTAKIIDQPPIDAKLLLSLNSVKIQPGQEGRKLSYSATLARLKSRIDNKTKKIEVAVRVRRPDKTTADIKKLHIEKLVAEYSTSLSPGVSGRRYNIELAMRTLDNTYVPPGTVFSFNKVVGPRTRKAGFTEAPVIERGQLVQGIGGGICQVATTIYNAAMIAGLPTVERSVHSNYISHYPAGRDATVVDGAIDFKFRNDTNGTLVIKTQVTSNAVIFRIYGPDTGRITTFSQPEVLNIVPYGSRTETDTALPPGVKINSQAGIEGRTVRVVRKVTLNGKTLINETIVSRYTPRTEIIKVGPEPPPPPSTESSATPTATP
ncbi:MAG: VanW family protein [Actinomycetota bacterium]|nr:VanW family protein [Actinomycetota bacterium]